MPSTREQALKSLFLCLKNGLTDIAVLRNEALPTKVPETGLVILRDGDIGEPEVSLSPTRYHYQHQASLEVFIQEPDANVRAEKLDFLLSSIGTLLSANTTLSSAVDYMHVVSFELVTEHQEGAPTLSAAVVPVILEYSTTNPLN